MSQTALSSLFLIISSIFVPSYSNGVNPFLLSDKVLFPRPKLPSLLFKPKLAGVEPFNGLVVSISLKSAPRPGATSISGFFICLSKFGDTVPTEILLGFTFFAFSAIFVMLYVPKKSLN